MGEGYYYFHLTQLWVTIVFTILYLLPLDSTFHPLSVFPAPQSASRSYPISYPLTLISHSNPALSLSLLFSSPLTSLSIHSLSLLPFFSPLTYPILLSFPNRYLHSMSYPVTLIRPPLLQVLSAPTPNPLPDPNPVPYHFPYLSPTHHKLSLTVLYPYLSTTFFTSSPTHSLTPIIRLSYASLTPHLTPPTPYPFTYRLSYSYSFPTPYSTLRFSPLLYTHLEL